MHGKCLLWVAVMVGACGPAPLPSTGERWDEPFDSAIVEDRYILRYRTPPGHDPSVAYPLVVVLDPTFAGLRRLDRVLGLIAQGEAEGWWPDTVVVGVDYDDPWKRHRDYVPQGEPDPDFGNAGADRFYAALRDEILPEIDARVAVDEDDRTIAGFSNGGVFAFYTALRHAPPEPPLFQRVIAGDFGIGSDLFLFERWLAERASDLPIAMYTSHAVFNGATQLITHAEMSSRLRGREYPSLQWREELLETDHGGADPISLEHGLDFVLREVR